MAIRALDGKVVYWPYEYTQVNTYLSIACIHYQPHCSLLVLADLYGQADGTGRKPLLFVDKVY